MKRLIGYIGDRLQAAFPPNRLAILLAAPILAAAAWVSGVVAANIPGVNLPVGVIAGVMGAGVLIVARLLDRWFDQWQKGEPINVDSDLENALDELADGPEIHAFYAALGTMQVLDEALTDLHGRIAGGTINEAEIARSVDSLGAVVVGFLKQHLTEEEHPAAAIATDAAEGVVPAGASEGIVPTAAAVPPAAPQFEAPPGAPAGPPANVE